MENNINPVRPPMETTITSLFSSPQPRKEFVDDLAMKLHFQYLELKSTPIEIEYKKGNWFNSFRRKIQARPVFLVLSILIALLILTGVVYAFGRLSGYIPGFGFTNSSGQATYVLDESVVLEQDNIIFQLHQAVSDEVTFWVEIQVENLSEEPVFSSAYLILEDGSQLESQAGYSEYLDNITTLAFRFSHLSPDLINATLIIEELLESPVSIPFRLRPIQEDEILPMSALEDYPISSESVNGLMLSLDYVAPASDRTIFQVSVHFDQPGSFIIGPWTVSLQDQNGKVYPLTEITPSNIDRNKSALYQTTTFKGNESLILKLRNEMQVENKINIMRDYSPDPGKFMFDPGENPQPGQIWELDEKVQVGDTTLYVVRAELFEEHEISFEFAADPNVTAVMLYADVPDIRNARSRPPVENQNFSSAIGFHQIPNEPFEIEIGSVYLSKSGVWQLEWTPPAAPMGTSARLFPTAIVPTMITSTATVEIEDDLYQRVKTLSDQFDAPYQQGPGWVRVVREQHSKVEDGQVGSPAYYKTNEWYEIDMDGYIQRSLYTDFNENGTILQQAATIGNYSINFTFGGSGYNELEPRQFSLDRLNESFLHADEYKSEISGEEVDCQDGKRCLLIRVKDLFEQPIQEYGSEKAIGGTVLNVWINLETGLQFKLESIYLYNDGSEEVRSTRQVLQVEKVEQVPAEVIGILDRVVLP
jgi:hypothetical protein